jgi:hypothetical protein
MKFFLLLFLLIVSASCFTQTDSAIGSIKKVITIKKVTKPIPIIVAKKDTIKTIIDTTKALLTTSHIPDSLSSSTKDSITIIPKDVSIYKLLEQFPLLNNSQPEIMITNFRENKSKDFVFYLLVGIVFLLALIQIIFPRYFKNIFTIFFQTSFRQNIAKEQLSQDNIAALLLNILFIISASCFLALIAGQFIKLHFSFWQIFVFAIISLSTIYSIKLFFTMFMGWVFNKSDLVTSYSFIVFIINKIIGVSLIPFLFLIAYSTNELKQVSFSIALILLAVMFLYRFFNTYKTLSSRLKINAIHFFLYFCGVEILPLLLMYKALNSYIISGI